jgi:parallel beta-helix repeat protein
LKRANIDGILCDTGGDNTTIADNIVGGNFRVGVLLLSRNNVIQRNIVGLGAALAGADPKPNGQSGVECGTNSENAIIVGNTVSGNWGSGIRFYGRNNLVIGNFIGLDPAGNALRANRADGIRCDTGCENATIVNNTISGNGGHGVSALSSRNVVVRGNIIGLDVSGSLSKPNTLDGIHE